MAQSVLTAKKAQVIRSGRSQSVRLSATLRNVASATATQPLALYFIALAQQGLGQAQTAAESLAQAKTSHDEILASLTSDDRDELALVRVEIERRFGD